MNLKNWFTRLRVGAFVLTAAASLISANSANAALLVYEPFDYPVGGFFDASLSNVGSPSPQQLSAWNGGTGFADRWQLNSTNANNLAAVSGSFTYTDGGGRSLVTAGNRAWATGNANPANVPAGDNTTGTAGNTANSQAFRNLAAGNERGYLQLADSPTTTWISFLSQVPTTTSNPARGSTTPFGGASADGGTITYGRAAALQLFNTNNEQMALGRASQDTEPAGLTNDTHAIYNRGSNATTQASGISLTELVFTLVRIDHNPGFTPTGTGGVAIGNDVAYVWFDPDLATEPTLGTQALTINANQGTVNTFVSDRDYNFNRIRIFGGSNNGTVGYGSIQLDEIRVGTGFADVTPYTVVPEPGSFALAALGLAAIAGMRRKV